MRLPDSNEPHHGKMEVFFMNLIFKRNKTVRFLITFENCFKSAHHELI